MRISSFMSKGLLAAFAGVVFTPAILAQEVTFHKDIEPILQRSCQTCHRDGGVAPMALVTYDEVAPFAGLIEYKTGLRDRAGAMPPWYVEHDVGIQQFKSDPSLSDAEIAAISTWARGGTPKGDSADAPEPLNFDDSIKWSLGEPDLIVETEPVLFEGGRPDWWGELPLAKTGMTEDRYVKSVEIKEVNDVDTSGSEAGDTVGGLYVFHHMIWRTEVLDESGQVVPGGAVNWPVHEVGRNGDVFDPEAGPLLAAGSAFYTDSVHMHSNGRDTTSRLQIGFTFHPKGYEPKYKTSISIMGNGVDISVEGDGKDQELHAYQVLTQNTKIITFEPHLHAPGERMCLEAIWGYSVETLSCVGYDHNWVRGYAFEDDYTPLLPKGTVLHITGYFDNTNANPNVADARNWQGSGNRSVTNMFIDLGSRVPMTDEQFFEEMEKRRDKLDLGLNDHVIGCPLCLTPLVWPLESDTASANDELADDAALQAAN